MRQIDRVIYQQVKPNIGALSIVLLLMIAIVGLEALTPWPFKLIIDNVLGGEPVVLDSHFQFLTFLFEPKTNLAFISVFLFFTSNFLRDLVLYIQSTYLRQVTNRMITTFSEQAFKSLESFDFRFYRKQEFGDYLYRLSDDVLAIEALIESGLLPIISSALYIVVTTVILFLINVELTFFSLLVLPFLVVGLYITNKRIVKSTRRLQLQNSALFSFMEEALSQLKIIQVFSQEKKESKRFNEKVKKTLGTDYQVDKLNFLLTLVIASIIGICYTLIITLGIQKVFMGQLSTGLLVIFIFYLDNLTYPVVSIIYAISQMKETNVELQRLNDFFISKTHIKDTGKITEITEFGFTLENVSLTGDEDTTILDNISCYFPSGKITALVGTNGSGKTSVISLITRIIAKPNNGAVYLGGKNMREYSLETIRKHIALVPQETVLFNNTILQIINYGNPSASLDEIKKVAKLAQAHEFIEKLPGKYHFRVGESGNYLSGGQRQKLMLARALLKNAEVLVLDEVLSSLDVLSRKKIWENICEEYKHKTVIISTNILDILQSVDHIVMLNNGRVIEKGKHSDLFKEFGIL